MVIRLLLVYLVVELLALAALVSLIGFGWTVLVLLASVVVGLVLAGAQARRQLARLRTEQDWRGSAADSAAVALGTIMVVIPGLVSTAAGLLLLMPATRSVVRPVLTAAAVAGLGRRARLVTATAASAYRYASRPRPGDYIDYIDYIDGEVLDVTDAGGEPPEPPARLTP